MLVINLVGNLVTPMTLYMVNSYQLQGYYSAAESRIMPVTLAVIKLTVVFHLETARLVPVLKVAVL
jgi:hypothetical protein